MTFVILKSPVTNRATRKACYKILSETSGYYTLERPTIDGPEPFRVHRSKVFCESPVDLTEQLTILNDKVALAFAQAEFLRQETLAKIEDMVIKASP